MYPPRFAVCPFHFIQEETEAEGDYRSPKACRGNTTGPLTPGHCSQCCASPLLFVLVNDAVFPWLVRDIFRLVTGAGPQVSPAS